MHQPIKGKTFSQHLFIAYWQKQQFDRCRDSHKVKTKWVNQFSCFSLYNYIPTSIKWPYFSVIKKVFEKGLSLAPLFWPSHAATRLCGKRQSIIWGRGEERPLWQTANFFASYSVLFEGYWLAANTSCFFFHHAVHRYTLKSIQMLRRDTAMEEVIVWSDGAASQYKVGHFCTCPESVGGG